jgi:hypothetical protein
VDTLERVSVQVCTGVCVCVCVRVRACVRAWKGMRSRVYKRERAARESSECSMPDLTHLKAMLARIRADRQLRHSVLGI